MSFSLAIRCRSLVSPFCRAFQSRALLTPAPPPRGIYALDRHGVISLIYVTGDITTPEAFLKAIGRGSETKITFETWDGLWKANGLSLKKAGVAVRDRRCVL